MKKLILIYVMLMSAVALAQITDRTLTWLRMIPATTVPRLMQNHGGYYDGFDTQTTTNLTVQI